MKHIIFGALYVLSMSAQAVLTDEEMAGLGQAYQRCLGRPAEPVEQTFWKKSTSLTLDSFSVKTLMSAETEEVFTTAWMRILNIYGKDWAQAQVRQEGLKAVEEALTICNETFQGILAQPDVVHALGQEHIQGVWERYQLRIQECPKHIMQSVIEEVLNWLERARPSDAAASGSSRSGLGAAAAKDAYDPLDYMRRTCFDQLHEFVDKPLSVYNGYRPEGIDAMYAHSNRIRGRISAAQNEHELDEILRSIKAFGTTINDSLRTRSRFGI